MSYDGWIQYGGVELINLSRTAQLAAVMGVDVVWSSPEETAWLQTALGGSAYDNVANAPWYDATYAGSSEFAGIIPLALAGLDDSSITSTTTEYVGDGGRSGGVRAATLPIVANVVLVASTERGAEYGLRWMKSILRAKGQATFCSGVNMRYLRYKAAGAPVAHRRDVSLTRAPTVTRKRSGDCSALWTTTFTLTCDDPYEYGDAVPMVSGLGGLTSAIAGPRMISKGGFPMTQQSCPVYDYSPIYDPLYPALVPSPTAPNLLPDGWDIQDGDTFQRLYARVTPLSPTDLLSVPIITLTTADPARMVRVSIWPGTSAINDQCDPLFCVVVSYLPTGQTFYIDGEQKAAYVWDGVSPAVRRTDSLTYSPTGGPVEWTAFNDADNLLFTVDIFSDSDGYEGDNTISVALAMMPKSD